MKRAMSNLAIGLVGRAFPLVAILSVMRLRSRFAISWVHAGVLAMLSVPAGLIGRWLVAASLFAGGLTVMGILVLLDRVASGDVVYDDHHTNLGVMFYTAASSSARTSSPAPAMTRMRALVRDSADM